VEPPAPEELDALLRLLDDETPEVRTQVAERLAQCGGDISEWLATRPVQPASRERELLVEMLSPPRRATLAREWIAPTGGAAALQEDWETFESLLRLLSDFLHDGITLRQPLSDALDLLAEEVVEAGVQTSRELGAYLFKDGRFTGNQDGYQDPQNSDLAWSIAEGRSNPLGLSLIFILVGRRLEMEVEGVNFPGHFMCRIYQEGYPLIIDCFDNGQLHLQFTLLESPELTRTQRSILQQSVGPGIMLARLLNNLRQALVKADRVADARLIHELAATLE
jgi:regulator of sirC expression with transglutaminase-like and TPR domain